MHQCKICKEQVVGEHQCYIQPAKQPKAPISQLIIYDMETTQNEAINTTTYRHSVNLVCAIVSCDDCMVNDLPDCPTCDKREWSFFGRDALSSFCRWLFQPVHKGAVAIAHNMSGK
jgi:hypothetical protein